MSLKIVLSSNNPHKLKEIKEILQNENIEILLPKDIGIEPIEVVEDGNTYIENAIKKAAALAPLTKFAVMSDDSGIEIESLNGMPGIRSARFADEHGGYPQTFEYIFEHLKGKNRNAKFVCHVALVNIEKQPLEFYGEVNGTIALESSGKTGFGYDPIFIPDGYNISFANFTQEDKNKISHRKKALSHMVEYLKSIKII